MVFHFLISELKPMIQFIELLRTQPSSTQCKPRFFGSDWIIWFGPNPISLCVSDISKLQKWGLYGAWDSWRAVWVINGHVRWLWACGEYQCWFQICFCSVSCSCGCLDNLRIWAQVNLCECYLSNLRRDFCSPGHFSSVKPQ